MSIWLEIYTEEVLLVDMCSIYSVDLLAQRVSGIKSWHYQQWRFNTWHPLMQASSLIVGVVFIDWVC